MSDILIKNMEMPKGKPIRIVLNPNGQLFVDHGLHFTEYEAVELPPHGKLIDADVLCKILRSLTENEYTPEVFANWIENHIDAIIPAEEEKV